MQNKVRSRATLIVTPPAISKQWISEIKKHTKANSLKVVEYHGVKSASHKEEGIRSLYPEVMADADIILTTFQVLAEVSERLKTLRVGLGWISESPFFFLFFLSHLACNWCFSYSP